MKKKTFFEHEKKIFLDKYKKFFSMQKIGSFQQVEKIFWVELSLLSVPGHCSIYYSVD